jgi:hypothetical protein
LPSLVNIYMSTPFIGMSLLLRPSDLYEKDDNASNSNSVERAHAGSIITAVVSAKLLLTLAVELLLIPLAVIGYTQWRTSTFPVPTP